MSGIRREFKVGQMFGRLKLIEELPTVKNEHGTIRYFKLICTCGKVRICRLDTMLKNKSCGCHKKLNITHGLSYHPIYRHWSAMLQRCCNKNAGNYSRYGGNGISVCDEWKKSFQVFYDWAISKGWQKGLQLDRFPNKNGNYLATNCRWATRIQNQNNQNRNRVFTYKNKTGTLSELSRIFLFNRARVAKRVTKLGYTISEAIEWNPNDHVNSKCK